MSSSTSTLLSVVSTHSNTSFISFIASRSLPTFFPSSTKKTSHNRSFFSKSNESTTTTASTNPIGLNTISSSTVIVPQKVNFQVPVYSFKKEIISTIDLPQHVFGSPLRTDILHRVLLWERAAAQQGTHKAKGRAEVSGSTKKMRPQKKQGTARMGGKRPPHFRGGGRAFGPIPRDHSFDLPKKVVKFGYRVGLSTKFAQDQLAVVDLSTLGSHKTKNLEQLMKENEWGSSILFIGGPKVDRQLELASGNLPNVNAISMRQISVYELLRRQKLIIDPQAIDFFVRYLNTSKEVILPPSQHEEEIVDDEVVEEVEVKSS